MEKALSLLAHCVPTFLPLFTNFSAHKNKILTLFFLFVLVTVQAQPWNQLTLSPPTVNHQLGIHFVDDFIGYSVGSGGEIRKTTDGGLTWTLQNSNTTQSLYSVHFLDANTGHVVGDNGVVLRTEDGGSSWVTATTPTISATHSFRKVWFYNAFEGYITGGVSGQASTILKTINGGKIWTSTVVPQGVGGQAIYGIYFITGNILGIGYACDFDGRILKSIDGGATWTAQQATLAQNHLFGISFPTATHGFVVGWDGTNNGNGNAVFLEFVNGTWSDVKSRLPSAGVNMNLSDIKFFGKTGYIVGGNVPNNTGIIYKTLDEGLTWTTETLVPLSGTNTKRLSKVTIPCSHTAFACGLDGTILKLDICPQKPPVIVCTCDNPAFNDAVMAGFTTTKPSPYTLTFKPNNLLTNCDAITWIWGDGSTTQGTSLGNAPITHTFPSAIGTYKICMLVARTTPTGALCKKEYCIDIRVDGLVAAPEVALPTMGMQPNPTYSSVFITMPAMLNNHTKTNALRISTVDGKLVKSIVVDTNEMNINVEQLPAGAYIISLYDNKGNLLVQPTKLVKQ